MVSEIPYSKAIFRGHLWLVYIHEIFKQRKMDIKRGRKLMMEITSPQSIDSRFDFRFWKFVYFCLLSVLHEAQRRFQGSFRSWLLDCCPLSTWDWNYPPCFLFSRVWCSFVVLSFLPRVLLLLQTYFTHFWLLLIVGLSPPQKEKSKTVVSQIYIVQRHMFCVWLPCFLTLWHAFIIQSHSVLYPLFMFW